MGESSLTNATINNSPASRDQLVKRGVLSRNVHGRLKAGTANSRHARPPEYRALARTAAPRRTAHRYIVMEYIDGEPIDIMRLSQTYDCCATLNCFAPCAPVHSAHQHLIVHRDLKHSNIW